MGVAPNGAPSVRGVFAENMRRLRKRQDLTQQQLVDRLDELGYLLDRTAIVRMERAATSDSRKVTIEDLVAVAAALNTSPTNLLVPFGPDERVAFTPKVETTATEARRWIRGWQALPCQSDDIYEELAPRVDWFFINDGLFLAYADFIERDALSVVRKDEADRSEDAKTLQSIGNVVAEVLKNEGDFEIPENPAVEMIRSRIDEPNDHID